MICWHKCFPCRFSASQILKKLWTFHLRLFFFSKWKPIWWTSLFIAITWKGNGENDLTPKSQECNREHGTCYFWLEHIGAMPHEGHWWFEWVDPFDIYRACFEGWLHVFHIYPTANELRREWLHSGYPGFEGKFQIPHCRIRQQNLTSESLGLLPKWSNGSSTIQSHDWRIGNQPEWQYGNWWQHQSYDKRGVWFPLD